MRLRYTGQLPVSFVTLGQYVEPGDEFEVPDDTADAYTGRADVEVVGADLDLADPSPTKAKRSRVTETPVEAPLAETVAEPQPTGDQAPGTDSTAV